jgi:F420-dependent oxidoreductase-like protein
MEYCTFTEPQQGYSYDDQLAFALATERAGFDGFFRSDHFMRMGAGDPRPGPTDAWTTLAGLARETSRIRLGTLVSSATHRVPAVLAVQVAQVDAMSGGRVELGLGTGWFEAEHRAYGIPFPAKRFGILEEQLAVITGLWSTPHGSRFDFDGEHYSLEQSPALPKPAQDRVPIIVGGGGPRRTPQLAAAYATEFNIGFRPEPEIAAAFARVRKACDQIDRDPSTLKLSVALTTVAGPDERSLARRAEATGRGLDEFRNDTNICGDADAIAEKVERLVALGAQRIYFQTLDMRDLEQIDYLGAEVLPALPPQRRTSKNA